METKTSAKMTAKWRPLGLQNESGLATGKNELPEQDLNKFQEMTELWSPPGLKRVVFVREGLQKSRSQVCWKRSTNDTQTSSKMITNEVRDSQNHAQSEYQNRLDFRDAKSSKSEQKKGPQNDAQVVFF